MCAIFNFIRKVQKVVFSHLDVFCSKGVLRNFAKFTGRQLCQSFFYRTPPVAVSESNSVTAYIDFQGWHLIETF